MEINNAYLLITLITDNKNDLCDSRWMYDHDDECSIMLGGSFLDGQISRGRRTAVLKPSVVDEYWSNKIEKIILYENYSVLEKTYLSLLYILKPAILLDIIQEPVESLQPKTHLIKSLIQQTFPDADELSKIYHFNKLNDLHYCAKEELKKYKLLLNNEYDFLKYKFLDPLLLIRPANSELKRLNNNEEKISDFLQRVEESFNREIYDKVIIPYHCIDLIETIHVILLNGQKIRIFISLKHDSHGNQIIIPDSLQDIHDFEKYIFELEEIKNRQTKIYSNRDDINVYIDSVSSKKMFHNYLKKFTVDRLGFLHEKFQIEEKLEYYKRSVKGKMPYYLKDHYETFMINGITRSNEPYSWCILSRNNRIFEELIRQIEWILKKSIDKDIYISEYLRDIVTGESIWSNLKLQRTLKFLTFIALILSLINIVMPLFSLEIKKTLSNFLKLFE